MEYKITQRGAELYAPVEFDLLNTFECGQCFRWMKADDGAYTSIVKGRFVRVYREGDTVIIDGTDEETFETLWREYFDIDTDYEALRQEMVGLCPDLQKAAGKLNGIRILRQEPWEALCSFIISQNNNIPRIQGIVSRLCENFGDDTGMGYSFPCAERIAALEAEDLAVLRAGFRARYIIDAARIARAAFFAPPISISPFSLFPPLITYCSISHLKNEMPLLIYYSLLLRLLFINSSFSIICSTVCSTFSPSSDIRISAYCSYNGVRSKNRS